ncbi:MAG: calcium-binding protein [Sphingomonadaceae bacterium]
MRSGLGNDTVIGSLGNDTVSGGDGDDVLLGGPGSDSLLGENGNDLLQGGSGTDTLNGGSGVDTADYGYATGNLAVNLLLTTAQTIAAGDVDTLTAIENLTGGTGSDVLAGTTAANVIKGGGGDDRITGRAGNDSLDGGAGIDVGVFAGARATYAIVTTNGTTTIVDTAAATDGNDGTDVIVGIEKAEFKGGIQVGIAAPIVLDLNRNGVGLIDQSISRVAFDWDGDGRANSTAWASSGDGLLVYDRNGDGTVTDASELSFTNDKPGATSDLDGLRSFDSNFDGVFSVGDAKWGAFKIWGDANLNGYVDQGELVDLASADVTEINLTGKAVNAHWNFGQAITVNVGSFTRSDGTSSAFSDVVLSYDVPSATRSLRASAFDDDRSVGGAAGEHFGSPRFHSDRSILSVTEPLVAQDVSKVYFGGKLFGQEDASSSAFADTTLARVYSADWQLDKLGEAWLRDPVRKSTLNFEVLNMAGQIISAMSTFGFRKSTGDLALSLDQGRSNDTWVVNDHRPAVGRMDLSSALF